MTSIIAREYSRHKMHATLPIKFAGKTIHLNNIHESHHQEKLGRTL
jgi:hypothetical protein